MYSQAHGLVKTCVNDISKCNVFIYQFIIGIYNKCLIFGKYSAVGLSNFFYFYNRSNKVLTFSSAIVGICNLHIHRKHVKFFFNQIFQFKNKCCFYCQF